jgi:hypothetical protein
VPLSAIPGLERLVDEVLEPRAPVLGDGLALVEQAKAWDAP